MSITDALLGFNQWSLLSADPSVVLALYSQYPPDAGVEYGRPVRVNTWTTPGSATAGVSWVSAGPGYVRISSLYQSLHNLDDITPAIDALELLTERDAALGRAPRVTFAYGGVELTGLVTNLTKRITGYWDLTGLPKRVEFRFEVMEAAALDYSSGGAGVGETQYITIRDGQSFETLGAQLLGDAGRGDLIRRINPGIAAGEVAGDRVKVLEKEHPEMRGRVIPTSAPFLRMADGSDPWVEVVEELGTARADTTAGLSWFALPEVISGAVV